MTNFDQSWDRNFQYLTEEELNTDYEFEDELEIEWSNKAYTAPQTCDYLIVATNRAYHMFHCVFSSGPGLNKHVKTKQQTTSKESFVFDFKPIGRIKTVSKARPKAFPKLSAEQGPSGDALISFNFASQYTNAPQSSDRIEYVDIYGSCSLVDKDKDKGPRIVYVNVPISFRCANGNLLSEFLLSHFKPTQKIIFAGRNVSRTKEDKKNMSTTDKSGCQAVGLESGNLVSSVNASILCLCEVQNKNAILYVCISDLDFMSEMLCKLFQALCFECVGLKDCLFQALQKSLSDKKFTEETLQKWIVDKCCDFGTNRNYLNTGINMARACVIISNKSNSTLYKFFDNEKTLSEFVEHI
ncbi:hypothetical protein RFI_24765 [Reticulomyxa filosa]|uniref:Proteasome assembly chaperone 1 n=1 Tax=Reticulomyxa filosa TaxID=46433 RepID=X6MFD5_RETFI|nr:hypothetical protein RFI_24765 [Reticulomyxa filosa]|eukprot:ETO12609.1 hypothetical protein RFI_24765 [Reticulomyxa filosa]